ncbi:MAG: c-type cytochrome [Chromatiales bacterium]|nr:MAG: c-type cytochrome [Chromatiales bacterium]
MNRTTTIICSILCVAGCAPTEEPEVLPQDDVAADVADAGPSVNERLSLGRDTYIAACADCHDEGRDGAPELGNPAAWSARSPLWESVLAEHAQKGFLQMPAKGGHTELSEEAVAAAVEYLVTWSQPDRPPSE